MSFEFPTFDSAARVDATMLPKNRGRFVCMVGNLKDYNQESATFECVLSKTQVVVQATKARPFLAFNVTVDFIFYVDAQGTNYYYSHGPCEDEFDVELYRKVFTLQQQNTDIF